jgi:hypothetical protein
VQEEARIETIERTRMELLRVRTWRPGVGRAYARSNPDRSVWLDRANCFEREGPGATRPTRRADSDGRMACRDADVRGVTASDS